MKSVGGMQRTMPRVTEQVGCTFTFAADAYNLIWLPKLIEANA